MEIAVDNLYISNMKSATDQHAIVNYNLFGETGDLPDVVHCETIEARSLLTDWTFSPHRHGNLHQVLVLETGGGEALMDGKRIELSPMKLVNVPAGCVHGYNFIAGTKGWVVTLAAEVLDDVLSGAERLAPAINRSIVVAANSEVLDLMGAIFSQFDSRAFARAHILQGLSAALIGMTARIIEEEGAHAGLEPGSARVRQFEKLLEQHFTDHWTVADYASALSISPTHLSRLCRSATGLPAARLIADRLVREARRLLVFTNLPVSTIAYELGFEDPAYFSRIFSRATGRSPRSFRADHAG